MTSVLRRCLTYRRINSCVAVIAAFVCVTIFAITGRNFNLANYCRIQFTMEHQLSASPDHSEVPEHVTVAAAVQTHKNLVEAMSARASTDRYIVLVMVDEAFADMAINFHEFNLRPYNIDNYLFVGVGDSTCEVLSQRHSLACFHYVNDPNAGSDSAYGKADFIRKMNIRTDMIIEALAAQFTVVHSDLDVAFLANPFNEIKAVMTKVSLAVLWDDSVYNAGFIVIKPTDLSRQLYHMVRAATRKSPRTDDQTALNNAIRKLKRKTADGSRPFTAAVLDKSRFLCGLDYFERAGRWFPLPTNGSCNPVEATKCPVVVHNNWIVSKAAKVYRFREHLMWLYDGEDEYYTSTTRRYLTYTNPPPVIPNATIGLSKTDQAVIADREILTLKTALKIGYLLNRIVILPRFHGGRMAVERPLNAIVHLKTFDGYFSGLYRENSFLRHPKVPTEVKMGLSQPQLLNHRNDTPTLLPQNVTISGAEVVSNFSNIADIVLVFSGLQGFDVTFENSAEGREFGEKLRLGLYHGDYRQFKSW